MHSLRQYLFLFQVGFLSFLSSDIPFTNGSYSHGYGAFYSLCQQRIDYDMCTKSLVFLTLDSSNIFTLLISHIPVQPRNFTSSSLSLRPLVIVKDSDVSKFQLQGWNSISVQRSLCNNYRDHLRIDHFSQLETIVVFDDSLRNLSSLTIANNSQLRTIEIKDVEGGEQEILNCHGACSQVKSICLMSMIILCFDYE